tara:strand:- start:328 stop:477 length:150 start_codon:yes stop_codon:yes gene_type:complete
MASPKNRSSRGKQGKKKTTIGNSSLTKQKRPGPHGGNKGYKKKYRGQGK